jgi:hypothetical protein
MTFTFVSLFSTCVRLAGFIWKSDFADTSPYQRNHIEQLNLLTLFINLFFLSVTNIALFAFYIVMVDIDIVDWSDCIIDGRYRVRKQIGAGSFGALQNLFVIIGVLMPLRPNIYRLQHQFWRTGGNQA